MALSAGIRYTERKFCIHPQWGSIMSLRRLIFILFVSVLISTTLSAQSTNLLTNPGFENGFETRSGEPPRVVATGWEPWHVAGGSSTSENQQPEYEETSNDPARIRTGSNGQTYFTFFATHTGGIYQRVTGITPGTELRFSIYGYIWSSSFEDVNFSEAPGDVVLYVGIDPTGGTDGTSSNIVWSPPAPNQYDAYREYSVIASATSNAVTVFVRSIVDFPAQNNYVYLDDAVLAPTTGRSVEQPSATPTATATTQIVQPTTEVPVLVTAESTPTREGTTTIVTPNPVVTTVAPPFIQTTVAPSATPTVTPTNTTAATVGPSNTPSTGTGGAEVFLNTIIHTVQRGDTVGRLAVLYNSTTQAIIDANSLNEDALIFVGQGLIIPVRLPAPASVTPSPTPEVIVITATPNIGTGGGGVVAGTVYIVQPGDTLFRIAARFNTTVAVLSQLNGIANPNRIQAGQQLLISAANTGGPVVQPPANVVTPVPPVSQPLTYVVRPGDNLYRISLRFNVSMASLVAANNIVNVNRIFAGQVLNIP